MKIVFFTKTTEIGPSSRYRVYQFLPYLRASGIDCVVYPLFGPTYYKLLEMQSTILRVMGKVVYTMVRFVKRGLDLLFIWSADLVVIEGQLFPYFPATAERVLVGMKWKVVVELDDAIYLTRWHQRKLQALLRLSTAAIVGNQTLAAYSRSFATTVSVVPTVVDTERFKPRDHIPDRSPCMRPSLTLVWVGLACNLRYLKPIRMVLRELQQSEGIRFLVISSRPPTLPGVEVEFMPWTFEAEVIALQQCQIGIMPLPDDEWARGKCGLKLLQYMAVGLAAVASPVGVNREIITHGQNGFLAGTIDDWYYCLVCLCRNAELRVKLGQAARSTVESRYSLNVWSHRLALEYRTLALKEKKVGTLQALWNGRSKNSSVSSTK